MKEPSTILRSTLLRHPEAQIPSEFIACRTELFLFSCTLCMLKLET